MPFIPIIIIILVVVLILVLATNLKVVQQSKAYVIERLGAFHSVWGVGIHFKVPFLERVAKVVSLKEQVVDFPPQPVITKDNVTMQIDTVLYFQITDPKLYAYGVERPMSAIENLSVTTMRNIIGDMDLEQTLTSRDTINSQMRALLDEATDPWGIKVNRVEVKNIQPPPDIQSAMEKQMKAEREKREAVLRAEGQRQSQILVAEGEKESMILRADAAKQAAIKKAEGEAEAILKVQQATAEAIKLLNEADPREAVLRIKALEAFQAAADGKATKIIIPSEIQGLAGLCRELDICPDLLICPHTLKDITDCDPAVRHFATEKEQITALRQLQYHLVLGDDVSLHLCDRTNTGLCVSFPLVSHVQIAEHLPLMGIRGTDYILETIDRYYQVLE